ncbi:MAG: hypothetical protein O9327_02135 [Polaromonas sp.]|nr:hypothetical protein [Polaromonas sp.]
MSDTFENHPLLLTAERMVALSSRMTQEEKDELLAWEREHVTGDGKFGTTDWPGWKAVVARLTH